LAAEAALEEKKEQAEAVPLPASYNPDGARAYWQIYLQSPCFRPLSPEKQRLLSSLECRSLQGPVLILLAETPAEAALAQKFAGIAGYAIQERTLTALTIQVLSRLPASQRPEPPSPPEHAPASEAASRAGLSEPVPAGELAPHRTPEAKHLWQWVLGELRGQVSPGRFNGVFSGTVGERLGEDGLLEVRCPSSYARRQLERLYQGSIDEALQKLTRREMTTRWLFDAPEREQEDEPPTERFPEAVPEPEKPWEIQPPKTLFEAAWQGMGLTPEALKDQRGLVAAVAKVLASMKLPPERAREVLRRFVKDHPGITEVGGFVKWLPRYAA